MNIRSLTSKTWPDPWCVNSKYGWPNGPLALQAWQLRSATAAASRHSRIPIPWDELPKIGEDIELQAETLQWGVSWDTWQAGKVQL